MSNTEETRASIPCTKPRVPCSTRPSDWDLDASGPNQWQQAIETCQQCPVLSQCRELVQLLSAKGTGPKGMIWAGIAYDSRGRVVLDLNQHNDSAVLHASMKIFRRSPNTISIHSTTREPFDATTVKGVHLVLRRRDHSRTSQRPSAVLEVKQQSPSHHW